MINGYDFDKTIYEGDSSVDFYKFCLKKNKKVLLMLPIQIYGLILYILGIIEKTKFKEYVFSFLKKIDDVDSYVKEFWKANDKKIKDWYLSQKEKTDIIISASPEFLLKPLERKYKFKVIASKVNKKTGKFEGKNCYGYEKVNRIKKEEKNIKFKSFYSDSMSDKPMMDIADNAYLVNKDKIYDLCDDREGKIKKYLKIDKILYISGILFLVVPIIIQLFFWYNRLVSIPCIILLIIATIFTIKKFKYLEMDEYKKIFNRKKLIFFFILIIIINVMSGAGGLFMQNWDYHGRNAIFRDLIENSWPVRYNYSGMKYEMSIFGKSGIFNYYFAFWLPGALIGKLVGFRIASLFMLLWQTIGVTLFFYYVCRFMRNIKYRYFFIFISIGGLNIIGHILMNKYYGLPISPIGSTHIDTSMGIFCMSSFITQLFWVFNQSIPAWIAVLLFLQQKDYRTCGFFFALLVPFGPFPMLGFLYLIFCYIIFGKNFDKIINLDRIKELLTIENFFGCISVLPIVFMYTLNESKKGMFIIDAIKNGNLQNTLVSYVLFVILEFFVYIVIINKKNFKPLLICFIYFAIAPLFYIGGADLGNRSTIPLLIILYLLVIKYLDEYKNTDIKIHRKQNVLIIILMIAFMTNFNEFYRSIKYTTIDYKTGNSNFADSYHSFSSFKGKEVSAFITNFVVKDDKSNKTLQWLLRK